MSTVFLILLLVIICSPTLVRFFVDGCCQRSIVWTLRPGWRRDVHLLRWFSARLCWGLGRRFAFIRGLVTRAGSCRVRGRRLGLIILIDHLIGRLFRTSRPRTRSRWRGRGLALFNQFLHFAEVGLFLARGVAVALGGFSFPPFRPWSCGLSVVCSLILAETILPLSLDMIAASRFS